MTIDKYKLTRERTARFLTEKVLNIRHVIQKDYFTGEGFALMFGSYKSQLDNLQMVTLISEINQTEG